MSLITAIRSGEVDVLFLANAGATDACVEVRDAGQQEPTTENLPPRHDLRNHSPDGFAWGYGGSGPAQLALAILAYLTDDETAQRHYQDFKEAHIATMPQDQGLRLDAIEVVAWLDAKVVARA